MVYNISSSIQVQPISTIPIWGERLSDPKFLLSEIDLKIMKEIKKKISKYIFNITN